MIDIQYIRDHAAAVKQKSAQKGYQVDIDLLLKLDAERLDLLKQVEHLRQKRNENAEAMKLAGKPDQAMIDTGKQIKIELAQREKLLDETATQWQALLKSVPNMPLDDVPIGSSEDDNVVVREVGEKPAFDFEPKSHVQIAAAKDWIDKERAAKVSGSRFAYLKGDIVHVQFALVSYVLQTLTNRAIVRQVIESNNLRLPDTVFIPIVPPVLIREEVYDRMDRLEPRDDRYHIDGDDSNLWLIGSAEHTLGSMFMQETLSADRLPLRYVGYSTSFRQEAGTYGKDTEGIMRMHQFDKLEMEVFSDAKSGLEEHQLLLALQEFMMQALGIAYRVVQKCTADIGKPNACGVDLDAWMPGQQSYRETHTADYMGDYQSRRLQSKVRMPDGSVELMHTNDATAFAIGRTLIAIIENFQTAEGDVVVPKVLRPFMGGRETI